MFVIIPAIYLRNDEENKTVITEEEWIQGLKYMLGPCDPHVPSSGVPS